MGEWIPLREALEHVTRVVHSRKNAKVQLSAKLERAELAARADQLETDGGAIFANESFVLAAEGVQTASRCEIPPSAWKSADIDWEANSFLRRYLAFEATPGHLGSDLPGYMAKGVHVSRTQLLAMFPAERPAKVRSQTRATKRSPGRPPGRSLAAADAPIVAEMRRLVEKGACASPSEAARQIIGRDGAKAQGTGTPENKIARLVRRYSESNGE